MLKISRYLKGNKFVLLSAFLPFILIFVAAFSFLWFVKQNQLEWLEEQEFGSHEEYFKYRDKQQIEIKELNIEIKEINQEMEKYLGEPNE